MLEAEKISEKASKSYETWNSTKFFTFYRQEEKQTQTHKSSQEETST